MKTDKTAPAYRRLYAAYCRRSDELLPALLAAGGRPDGPLGVRISPFWSGGCHTSQRRTHSSIRVRVDPPSGGYTTNSVHAYCHPCDDDALECIDALLGWGSDLPPNGGRLPDAFGAPGVRQSAKAQRGVAWSPPPEPEPTGLRCQPSGKRALTLGDLLDAPRWFPSWTVNKAKRGWWFNHPDGTTHIWKQSVDAGRLPDGVDNVRAAAEGVVHRNDADTRDQTVRPQMSWDDCLELLESHDWPAGVEPSVALGGTPDYPFEVAVGIFDNDWRPDLDTDGSGRATTRRLRELLVGLGCPVFPSTSGNGFHALVALSDRSVAESIKDKKESFEPPDIPSWHCEFFPPGAKNLVKLRIGAANPPYDRLHPLPVIDIHPDVGNLWGQAHGAGMLHAAGAALKRGDADRCRELLDRIDVSRLAERETLRLAIARQLLGDPSSPLVEEINDALPSAETPLESAPAPDRQAERGSDEVRHEERHCRGGAVPRLESESVALPPSGADGYVAAVLAEGRRLLADRRYTEAARTLQALDGRKDLTKEELEDWLAQHGLLSVSDWQGQQWPGLPPSSVRNPGWTDAGRQRLAEHHRQHPPSYPCDCEGCGGYADVSTGVAPDCG